MGSANSYEVEVYEGVWLAKSWEFALPMKFYFLQNGVNRSFADASFYNCCQSPPF
ncbi:hypothetical protein BVRB_013690 [Beta vulgaris subsp. vulgaris]|uniref:Uncharacterized protein n=1 Tax=Beta vulgaris subsp. vulgaris TaxID=3555 RepID=A0A0J8B1U9_BETVV|nr:hypothetical protein BVRB_013690 [Beta vulgaris subsp. vulgaris]